MAEEGSNKHSLVTLIIGWTIVCATLLLFISLVLHPTTQSSAPAINPELSALKPVSIGQSNSILLSINGQPEQFIEDCKAIGHLIRQYNFDEKPAAATLYHNRLLSEYRPKYPTAHIGLARIHSIQFEDAEIGMTNCEVIAALGFPKHINTTKTAARTSEQWIYETSIGRNYVYFDDDTVTAIQN